MLSTQPLDNCTYDDDTNVVCFQFVLSFLRGGSSALLCLGAVVIYFNVYWSLLLRLIGLAKSLPPCLGKEKLTHRIVISSIISTLFLLTLPSIIAIVVFTVSFNVPLFTNIILRSLQTKLNIAAYSVCFFILGPGGGVWMVVIAYSKPCTKVLVNVALPDPTSDSEVSGDSRSDEEDRTELISSDSTLLQVVQIEEDTEVPRERITRQQESKL